MTTALPPPAKKFKNFPPAPLPTRETPRNVNVSIWQTSIRSRKIMLQYKVAVPPSARHQFKSPPGRRDGGGEAFILLYFFLSSRPSSHRTCARVVEPNDTRGRRKGGEQTVNDDDDDNAGFCRDRDDVRCPPLASHLRERVSCQPARRRRRCSFLHLHLLHGDISSRRGATEG